MHPCWIIILMVMTSKRPREGTVTAHDIQFSTLVEDPQYFPYGVPSAFDIEDVLQGKHVSLFTGE